MAFSFLVGPWVQWLISHRSSETRHRCRPKGTTSPTYLRPDEPRHISEFIRHILRGRQIWKYLEATSFRPIDHASFADERLSLIHQRSATAEVDPTRAATPATFYTSPSRTNTSAFLCPLPGRPHYPKRHQYWQELQRSFKDAAAESQQR